MLVTIYRRFPYASALSEGITRRGPLSSNYSVQTQSSNVDLPIPEGPAIAVVLPAGNSRSRLSNNTFPPKLILTRLKTTLRWSQSIFVGSTAVKIINDVTTGLRLPRTGEALLPFVPQSTSTWYTAASPPVMASLAITDPNTQTAIMTCFFFNTPFLSAIC